MTPRPPDDDTAASPRRRRRSQNGGTRRPRRGEEGDRGVDDDGDHGGRGGGGGGGHGGGGHGGGGHGGGGGGGRGFSVVPLRRRPTALRLDVAPFAVVYAALIALDLKARGRGGEDATTTTTATTANDTTTTITALFAAALLCHVGTFLVSRWRTSALARIGYARRPLRPPAAPPSSSSPSSSSSSSSDARASADETERIMRSWTHALVTPLGPSGGVGGGGSATGATGPAEVVPLTLVSMEDGGGGGGGLVAVADFHRTALRCASSGRGTSDRDDEMDGIWMEAAGDENGNEGEDKPGREGGGGAAEAAAAFHGLRFPVDLPLRFYSRWTGHGTSSSLRRARRVYGTNAHPIVLPPFLRLLSEQLVAPFFLFQLFCVLLWSLDEYWYYAIFTLFTLVMFECTVSFNRLKSLQRLRETLRPPYRLWVYREGSWGVVRSDELVAGDVVSLSTEEARDGKGGRAFRAMIADPHDHEGGRHVPADCLLLGGGTAVVDEAALTGESVPQMKEPVDAVFGSTLDGGGDGGDGKGARLDVGDPTHRRSVLFGGTLLVNHCPAEDGAGVAAGAAAAGNKKEGIASIPPPPDSGLTALVMRTGFDTTQGSLLRTMVHTSVRGGSGGAGGHHGGGGVDGRDTFVFICVLLLCALLSSLAVLEHGWSDPTRNRFKLVLHVIIIVTSVVPPELPMELSLAVTSSLGDLAKRCRVYCTEPFRIPLAGMVDTCCFDKTGTITSDEMLLRGVRLPPPPSPPAEKGEDGALAAGGRRMACRDGTEGGGNEDLVVPGAGGDATNDSAVDGDGADSKPTGETLPRETLRVMVACHSLAAASIGRGGGSGGGVRRTGGGGRGAGGPSDGIVGDPLEKAVLKACDWTVLGGSVVAPAASLAILPSSTKPTGGGPPIKIHHRFAFASKLKRMTVLASDLPGPGAPKEGGPAIWALTKGAPETVKGLLNPKTVPPNYDAVFRRHMSMGQRVLALAHRQLGGAGGRSAREIKEEATSGMWGRAEVERDLTFAGFLVLDCPLKPDSRRVVRELKRGGHECVMVTGDAVLTAAEVARNVGIVGGGGGEAYELREVRRGFGSDDGAGSSASSSMDVDFDAELERQGAGPSVEFAFVPLTSTGSVGGEKRIAYVPSNLPAIEDMLKRKEIAGVCVSGEVLTKVAAEAVRRAYRERARARDPSSASPPSVPHVDDKSVLLHPDAQAELRRLVPVVSVFARHAPRQKEAVIAALNAAGRTTLMCGDGTNDVGALKMAHVGISIVSVPDLEAKQREAMEGVEKLQEEERKEKKRAKKGKKKLKEKGIADGGVRGGTKKSKKKSLEKHLRAMAEAEEELDFVALGDASVASPFTSKTMSIKCACDVLQRGRCTLVTMLQIYKILGINCLVNALVLTKLHMAGAKQGDRQLTVVGLVIAGLFLFVTKGQPLRTLSPERPPSSVLCARALLSIMAQFLVHFLAIFAVTDLSAAYMDPWDPSLVPDGPFNANVLNTSTFLMTVLATVSTFAINYQGRPFMEDLSENLVLLRSVQACYAVLFACAAEVFPPLNDLLQLSALPLGTKEDWMIGQAEGFTFTRALLLDTAQTMGFKATLCGLMVLDSVVAYAAEKAIAGFFEAPRK